MSHRSGALFGSVLALRIIYLLKVIFGSCDDGAVVSLVLSVLDLGNVDIAVGISRGQLHLRISFLKRIFAHRGGTDIEP